MQFLLDNLIGTMIAGTVVLILAAAHLTASQSAREATGYYATRAAAQTVVTVLDADLPNIGNEVPAATPAFVTHTFTSQQKVLEFRGRIAGAAGIQRVRYEAVPLSGAVCGAAPTCWDLRRAAYADGSTAQTPRRIGIVSSFDVTLLPVGATLTTATALDVRVGFVAPPGAGGAVARQTFAKRYRLTNLVLRTIS